MLLNSMVCYCESSAAACGNNINIEDALHEFFMRNDIATWKCFLEYKDERLKTLLWVDRTLFVYTRKITNSIPEMWKFIFTEDDPEFLITSMAPRTSLCLDGNTTVKECYTYLVSCKYIRNDSAVVKWTVDLDKPVSDNWSQICARYKTIYNPVLQDFARSFIHRSYYTNIDVAEFKTNVSPMCTFCQSERETLIHLYWNCPHVMSLWTKVNLLVFDHIVEDPFDKYHWLLSDFQVRVILIISVITKYEIFLARLNEWPVSYERILDRIQREKNNHLERTHPDKMTQFYEFWGVLISDSVFKAEKEKY